MCVLLGDLDVPNGQLIEAVKVLGEGMEYKEAV